MPYRGTELWGLDDRLPAVAFPGVDNGMILWAEIDREEGYIVRYPGSEKDLLSPQISFVDVDELARATYGSKADKKVEVAKATRTVLNLYLQHKRVSRGGPTMSSPHHSFPKPASAFLTLGQLSPEFRKMLEEKAKNLYDDEG